MTTKSLYQISLLALLFGTGSWIAITGLWMEMPLLIKRLPEGWALASHINIMIQFANIGPLLYWLAHRYRIANEISATHVQMILGIVSCAALIFFWDSTFHVFGSEHSVWLFVATFGLALVDCTSSVTFLPFMARFDSSYLTPYLVGEGLSGFIPSMVALAQGVGDDRSNQCFNVIMARNNLTASDGQTKLTGSLGSTRVKPQVQPRFSVEMFFLSLLVTAVTSYLAFLCLKYLPICKREMESATQNRQSSNNEDDQQTVTMLPCRTQKGQQQLQSQQHQFHQKDNFDFENIELSPLSGAAMDQNYNPKMFYANCDDFEDVRNKRQKTVKFSKQQKRRTYYYLLCLMCWNCFTTFGFMPSVQPYSALPYGDDVLHYVVILTGLAYPVGCFYGMLVENKSVRLINLLTILGTVVGLYIVVCALMSPTPPFFGQTIGGIVMIVAWITFVGTLSYAKTMTTLWICDFNSTKGMFWVGMNTQFGAAIGASVIFGLINYSRFFNECPQIGH